MHGLNTYDYGARQYNPVTARWDRVDPLAEKYYSISSYAYVNNNPIMLVDPDGRDWFITSDSTIMWRNDVTSDKNTPEGSTYIGKEYDGLIVLLYNEATDADGNKGLTIQLLLNKETNEDAYNWEQTVSGYEYQNKTNEFYRFRYKDGGDKEKNDLWPYYFSTDELKDYNYSRFLKFEDFPARSPDLYMYDWNATLKTVGNKKITITYGFHNYMKTTFLKPIKILKP